MIKQITLALALATTAVSCSKFLDIQPVGKVIPNSAEEYRALLSKAYSIALLDKGITEVRTDIAQVRNNEFDQNSYGDIERWRDVSPTAGTQPFGWLEYYEAIYYANAVIDRGMGITGATDEVSQLIGEAYMLRAMMHFTLVNLYGQPYTKAGAPESKAIPLRLNLDLESLPQRSTVQAVYEQVLSDIATARTLLKRSSWEAAQSYRFSLLSATALEARVLLYMGKWEEAYKASEAVLAQKADLVDLNEAGTPLPNQYNSAETITAYEQTFTSSLGSALRAPAQFVASFSPEDQRLPRYFGEQDATHLYYPVIKTDGTSTYRNSFRTAEYYLSSAEAAARMGQLGQARSRLLVLLSKRYSPVGYASLSAQVGTMGQDALLELILQERSKELAYEGHRWFDLRRSTRPALSKTLSGTAYSLSADDARYTLRIPAEAIEANPSLDN